MKRLVLALLTIFALTAAGAVVAQSPNTVPPGPTQQREPGLTSNNLPNPGNPQTNLSQPTTTTGTTTGVAPETEQGEGMDVDIDTGARANGAVDVDVTRTSDADTDASGIDETGGLDNDANDVNTANDANAGANADQDTLPSTASDLPLVALLGLLCLGAAYSVRTLAKREI